MKAFTHVPDAVGEECDTCGTTHEVVESVGDDPLSPGAVESLGDQDRVEYARSVGFFDEGRTTGSGREEMTTHVVISTAASTRLLSYFDDHGWVKVQEWAHADHERPAAVGEEMLDEVNKALMKQSESIPAEG